MLVLDDHKSLEVTLQIHKFHLSWLWVAYPLIISTHHELSCSDPYLAFTLKSWSVSPFLSWFYPIPYSFKCLQICFKILLKWFVQYDRESHNLVLTHAAIQIVYCHYMLIPFVKCLWYFKFWHLCIKQEDQSVEWTTKGQAMG